MDMRNSFFVFFVFVLEKCSEKKFATITKESRKIRTNFRNFCMHSRLYPTIGTAYTLFFIWVSGLWEIYCGQVEIKDFLKVPME
jgi:hypothetical protein